MTKRCTICVANGHWYPRGAARQKESLIANGFPDADIRQWVNEYPPGCPTHQDVPYAFKPYAFQNAYAVLAYTTVLWMDASCYAIGSLDPVFEQIERDGYLLFANDATVGEWCADSALPALRLTRDEAMEIPEISACVMGLDFRHQVAREFFDKWMKLANDGITFKGSHTNKNGECSADPRVKGHRHDQTAASVLAYRLGMKHTHMPMHLSYKFTGCNSPDTRILNSGM